MIKSIRIGVESVAPGEEKQINANVAMLPTRTPIDIPIIVSRSNIEGPIVLFLGGVHGDEINGVEIVRRLIVNGYHRVTKGSTICIPLLNVHGFINLSREFPDGKDANRSFPGSKNGSLASQIAYHLTKFILPHIDCGVDFHTGGSRINNYPQIRAVLSNPNNLELAKAFAPKFIINSGFREKSLRKEASKQDKTIMVYEAGESLRLRKNAIDHGVNGALRLLKHLGMREEAPAVSYEPKVIKSSTWIRAKGSGLYHSFVRPGDQIKKNEKIGLITGPFGQFEVPIQASSSGYVLAVNNKPVINRGDALIHVGVPYKS